MSAPVLYVGNLNPSTSANVVGKTFEQYGDVVNATISTRDGRSLGFGFVQMVDQLATDQALSHLNGFLLEGRRIRVQVARNQNALAPMEQQGAPRPQAPPQQPPRAPKGQQQHQTPYRPTPSTNYSAPPRYPERSQQPARQQQPRRNRRGPRQNPRSYMMPAYPNFTYPYPVNMQQQEWLIEEVRRLTEEIKTLRKEKAQPKEAQPKKEKKQPQPKPKAQPTQPKQPKRSNRQSRRRPRLDPSEIPQKPTTVHIRSVPLELTLDELRTRLSEFHVKDVQLPQSRFNTKHNAGYGFIEFSTPDEQKKFLSEHPTLEIGGVECKLEPAYDIEKLNEQLAANQTSQPPKA